MDNQIRAAADTLLTVLRDAQFRKELLLLYGYSGAGKTDIGLTLALALAIEDALPVLYCLRNTRPSEKVVSKALQLLAESYQVGVDDPLVRREGEWTLPEWVERQTELSMSSDRADLRSRTLLGRLDNLFLLDAYGMQLSEVRERIQAWQGSLPGVPRDGAALIVIDGLYAAREANQLQQMYTEQPSSILVIAETEMWRGEGEQAVQQLIGKAHHFGRVAHRSVLLRDDTQRLDAWNEFGARDERVRRFIADDARQPPLPE